MSPAWSNPSPGRSRADYVYFNYRCTVRRNNAGCGFKRAQINGNKIEAAVWDELCKILTDPTELKSELQARRQNSSHARNQIEENVASIQATLEKVETELTRLLSRVAQLDESLFDMVKEQIDAKTKQRNRLRETLQEVEADLVSFQENACELDAMELYCKGFAELLPTLSFDDKRAIVSFFVQRVIGNKGATSMSLSIPTSPEIWLTLSKTGNDSLPTSDTTLNAVMSQLGSTGVALTVNLVF